MHRKLKFFASGNKLVCFGLYVDWTLNSGDIPKLKFLQHALLLTLNHTPARSTLVRTHKISRKICTGQGIYYWGKVFCLNRSNRVKNCWTDLQTALVFFNRTKLRGGITIRRGLSASENTQLVTMNFSQDSFTNFKILKAIFLPDLCC